MVSKRWMFVLLLLCFAGYLYQQRQHKPIRHTSGVLVEREPVQTMLDRGDSWQKGDYTIKALADIKLNAQEVDFSVQIFGVQVSGIRFFVEVLMLRVQRQCSGTLFKCY